ncbi:MAG: heme lyase CcmF/NrfE family subunit [Alphaproteobacteria bacterium]
MIVETGHYALILALALAVAQSVGGLLGPARRSARLAALADSAALGQALFASLAFGALVAAHVTSDFSVANVASNSHSSKPMLYKVAGAWGNHEGSMAFWVLILALFGAAVAAFGANLPASLRARVLGVQGVIGTGFLAFVLFTSNPFARVFPPPLDGKGLNPLLQDPGLAFHPPFLYLGYVGFSVTFAFAVAALLEGRVDAAWARWVRPWALAAWSFLTVGIALGSWWAYYELGWGGFWFWDPVENASFLPWLIGTALVHSAIVCERRGALKSWTVLLAILAFSLSLIGTFLVRSGVLTSVHAFASDPERGVFILALIAATVGGSLALYAWRAPRMVPGGSFEPISREGALVVNNLLLATAAATVFLGTLYPLFLEALGGEKISVGAPYFDATFVPLALPLFLLMGVGPSLAWKRADARAAFVRLRFAAALAGAVALAVLAIEGGTRILPALGIGLSVWIAAGVAVDLAERTKLFRAPFAQTLGRARHMPLGQWGMAAAHLGAAIVIAGVTASSAWQTEKIQMMRAGDAINLADYRVVFEGVRDVPGPNYIAERGTFRVSKGEREIAVLLPERRTYPVERQQTTEAAIHTTWLADIYIVIGESDGAGAHAARLYYNPLVPWIWLGAIIAAFGGALASADRRARAVGTATASAPDARLAT